MAGVLDPYGQGYSDPPPQPTQPQDHWGQLVSWLMDKLGTANQRARVSTHQDELQPLTAGYYQGSRDLARSGLDDLSYGGVLTGLPKYMLGSAGMIGAPLGAATKYFVEDPLTKLTGNPDFGSKAGLLAGLPEMGGAPAWAKTMAMAAPMVPKAAETAAALSKTERFNWPVRTSYGKTIDMPVSVNPSKSMITRELAQAPHGDVRALRAPNGDVYMWPANEAMHVDIADTFDLPFKTRQHLQSNSYLFNKGDVDALGKFSDFDDLVKKIGATAE